MKHPLCIVLVILVFSTSPNEGRLLKSNERRAAGLVPFPRIGRHFAMGSYARPDGNAGMVNYPRVGRSGPREFYLEPRIDNEADFDFDVPDDFDYSANHPLDYEESRKRYQALRENGLWLGGRQSSGHKREPHRSQQHRCNQQFEGPWALLFAPRDFANSEQQPIRNVMPTVPHDMDHDVSAANNIIS